jgi:hypothetical protein
MTGSPFTAALEMIYEAANNTEAARWLRSLVRCPECNVLIHPSHLIADGTCGHCDEYKMEEA